MLVTLREVLAPAMDQRYAVPAFDCVEDVMLRAILETAEEKHAPVILMALVGAGLNGNGWVYWPGLARAVADHHKIPIVLHLDHASSLDEISAAVEGGFSSVMIDGSRLPFGQNVQLTKAAADIAHRRGLSVEGELGHVGGANLQETRHVESILTEPGEVAQFVAQTGVDALAVSIGTAHGVYRAQPRLNIERLKQLRAASPVPLVLHGGSGTPADQLRQAVRNGICKVNLFADQRRALGRGLRRAAEQIRRDDPMPEDVFGPIKEQLVAVIAEKIDLLSAANRA